MDSESAFTFPLAIFLFPGEQIQLHLFEPRYKQLFKFMSEHQMECIVPYIRNGKPQRIGCALKLREVVNLYDDGRADAIFQCTRLIEITRYEKSANSTLPDSADFLELHRYTSWQASTTLLEEWSKLLLSWPKLAKRMASVDLLHVLHLYQLLRPTYEEKYYFIALGDPLRQEELVLNKIRFQRLIIEQEKNEEHGFFLN